MRKPRDVTPKAWAEVLEFVKMAEGEIEKTKRYPLWRTVYFKRSNGDEHYIDVAVKFEAMK